MSIETLKKTAEEKIAQLFITFDGRQQKKFSNELHDQKLATIHQEYEDGLQAMMSKARSSREVSEKRLGAIDNPFAVYNWLTSFDIEKAGQLAPFLKEDFAKCETAPDVLQLMKTAAQADDTVIAWLALRYGRETFDEKFSVDELVSPLDAIESLEDLVVPEDVRSERDFLAGNIQKANEEYNFVEQHTTQWKQGLSDNIGVQMQHIADPVPA